MNDFKSILIGGFECADQINIHGNRINLLDETEHHIRVYDDYRALKSLGIETVREGICWSRVEYSPGRYDFSEVLTRMQAANECGIQQIWDLIHFGFPDDLYPSHPQFCNRFVNLCREFTLFFISNSNEELHVVPINEIGFLSWLGGEVGGTVPFVRRNGWDMKYRLCEAAILGIKSIREVNPLAQVYLVEPLIWVHAGSESDFMAASLENSYQYQAMDIILGRICPELGGSPDLVDGLGFNYYWNCQWEINFGTLPWPHDSNKRKRLSALLLHCYSRFNMPMFISETGHFGVGRASWFEEIVQESINALELGVDLRGICIYPIIDRPDWDNLSYYHNSGLWDLSYSKNRIIDEDFFNSLKSNYPILKQAVLELSI
jgi:beta-glucosidase/6-phospho-beta-glucosidase/beta-galactosidase